MEDVRWLALLLQLETSLVCLDLRSNLLGGFSTAMMQPRHTSAADGGAQILAGVLTTNVNLQKLVLYENGIGEIGARAIFQACRAPKLMCP